MKSKYFLILSLVVLIGLIASCSKSNSVLCSWDYQGRHYVADSASCSRTADNKIVAYSGVTAIAIDGGGHLATGTYTFHGYNTTAQPFMAYVSISTFTYSQSGTLTITYNDNSKISGNFSATLTDGTGISGSFTDMPIR